MSVLTVSFTYTRRRHILKCSCEFLIVDACTERNKPCGSNAVCVKGKRDLHVCACQDGYNKIGGNCQGKMAQTVNGCHA